MKFFSSQLQEQAEKFEALRTSDREAGIHLFKTEAPQASAPVLKRMRAISISGKSTEFSIIRMDDYSFGMGKTKVAFSSFSL